MKKLCDIVDCIFDIEIAGIADDSRKVKPGYLFVATHGFNVDHTNFINDAIANGAVAVIADRKLDLPVPLVVMDNVDDIFSDLCQKYFDINPDDFNIIGITGTDGKTTTASLIDKIVESFHKIAYIGTNGVDIDGEHFDTSNTTPCIFELYECFYQIKKRKCKDVVMEVSSEALLHGRINKLKFDVIAYTNITEDHLNIHGNIDNYCQSKFKLIDYLKDEGIIFVNGDDNNCKKIVDKRVIHFGYSLSNDFIISNFAKKENGIEFNISDKNGINYNIVSPLNGKYNSFNLTLAFLICKYKDIPAEKIINRINNISTIIGRGEKLNFGQSYEIVLDYAHTYNAIKNILDEYKKYNRVIVVTGAAGGREKEKRSKIGKLLLENAGFVIFTMDDPRNESVYDIIDQMIDNSPLKNYDIIVDRKEAIYSAFSMAKSGDAVLIIGKGRDNYMAIGNKKIKYSDYDTIKKYFD